MSTFIETFRKTGNLVNYICQPDVSLEGLKGLLPSLTSTQLQDFYEKLKRVKEIIKQDKEFLFSQDPSIEDIFYIDTFTSAFAVALYRIAHIFPDKIIARQITEYAKSRSGIDIHPEAQIGVPFAIDHGVGTVIGQTCVIGDRCLFYHGVTLGAKHLKNRDQYGVKRHPIIGNDVVIYSNTTILGNLNVPNGTIIYANKFIKDQEEIDKMVKG